MAPPNPDGRVVTRSNRGQWETHVEGRPELSKSFSSRGEAVQTGAALAAELGFEHEIEQSNATGVITDQEEPAPPPTTDDEGMPLENPSG